VSRNCKYSRSEIKNRHSKNILSEVSRPIKNEKVLINDITENKNINIEKIIV